mmetsp:Transcript_16230/g.30694  ORF Transcript_16230/g.30694 Transcript_16230/m.30694 type:complete len:129 (+) Transcript_16230:193-579(+)
MQDNKTPKTISEYDNRDSNAWVFSFTAAMVPFTAFCYGHSKGVTGRVLEKLVKMPGGFYGIFALPFLTLGMEKCIYDTAQCIQGIDPNIRPADRGGFPSGGANLPSFSLCPVQERNVVEDLIKEIDKK